MLHSKLNAHGMLLVAIRGVEVVATPVAPAALVRASPASAKWRFAGHTAAVRVRRPGRTAARHFAPHYDAHAVSWGHGGRIQRAEDPTGEPPKTYPKNTTYPQPLLLLVHVRTWFLLQRSSTALCMILCVLG